MKDGGKKGRTYHEKAAISYSRLRWNFGAKRHIVALCLKKWSKGLNSFDEGDESFSKETHENDEEMHAWCTRERK